MAFQDEAFGLRDRLHLGKVKLPVLVGALCVAILVMVVVGIGVAHALSTEGFAVTKAEEGTSAASNASAASESAEAEEPARLCVFVSGEVAHPAIYYLDEGARVADAITAAGGFTPGAATDALNLARAVVDGEQIAVPAQNSAATAPSGASAQGSSAGLSASGSSGSPSQAGNGRVNINTADTAMLQTLSGIGEATAKKIVADREANGPYKTIEDLKRVSGIGDKKFESLRDSICV